MTKTGVFNLFKTRLSFSIAAVLFSLVAMAQDEEIKISPVGTIVSTGEEITEYSGDAPLEVTFSPGEENVGSCTEYYEWRFYKSGGSVEEPYLIRHEKETTMTFVESGKHCVALYAYFVNGTDTVARFDQEYWTENTPITIDISESHLDMPNAFSPNGDGNHDIYRAKPDTYKSIVSFHATIYNRYGQKLYSWDDISQGWDGKYNGRYVTDGVYYVSVEAKGAEGKEYIIKKAVNVLKGTNSPSEESSSEE